MLTGVKDLDLIILNNLGDHDLVNILQTNTTINKLSKDQNFWLQRIMTKFPYLGLDVLNKYKQERTWSQYYIYLLTNKKYADSNLCRGSESGELDRVIIAVNNGANVSDFNIRLASAAGNLDVVKYLISQGANARASPYKDKDHSFKVAVVFGNLDVVKYLVSQGIFIFEESIYSSVEDAYENGHYDVVDYLVSCGVPDPRYNY